jgi:hypothetical protein
MTVLNYVRRSTYVQHQHAYCFLNPILFINQYLSAARKYNCKLRSQ